MTSPNKKTSHKINSLPLILLVSLLLSACDTGSSTLTTQTPDNKGIPVPAVIATVLPTNGVLSAYIRVDGSTIRQKMNIAAGFATVTLGGLSLGSHTITIEFEFQLSTNPDQPLMLASASKLIDVKAGENNLDFTGTPYDTDIYDDDNDDVSNLDELVNETIPFAGITVSAISNNTSESGTKATFTVVLNYQPSSVVNIPIASSDVTEGNVDKSVLTFTATNWDVPQVVTVTGVNDTIVDGGVLYTLITASVSSGDANYSGQNPIDVTVINTDNDYTIGGTVTGYTGTGLVLQNNNSDNLSVTGTSFTFTFASALNDGSSYNVTVLTQPANQICSIDNPNGNLVGVNITNIVVKCVTPPPAVPQGVSATPGFRKVTLDWTPVNAATGYHIYRSTNSPVVITASNLQGTVGSGANGQGKIEYINTNLVDSTTYYFIVTAYNSTGDGEGSLEVSAMSNGHLIDATNFPDDSFRNCLLATGKNYAEEITTAITCNYQTPAIASIEGAQSLYFSTALSLSGNAISDLTPLGKLTQLTALDLSGNNIDNTSNAAVIGNLVNLTTLNIYGKTGFLLSDVSWLANLDKTKLKILGLGTQHVGDPSTVGANMIALGSLGGVGSAMTDLDLGGNQFTSTSDASALGNLVGLTTLSIGNNQFSSFAWLANLSQLAYLDISATQITNTELANTSGLSNLTTLVARSNGANISNADGVSSLINLTRLDMAYCGLTDVTGIGYLTNLTDLDLSENRTITDAAPLGNLVNLKSLYLAGNQVGLSSILAMQNLTKLTVLHLSSNSITNASELATVLSALGGNSAAVLRELDIGHNKPSDADGSLTTLKASLESLNSSLQRLYLMNTGITDVSALTNMTNLRRLDLDNSINLPDYKNAVADVVPLATLVNMDRLYLENNNSQLTNLGALSTLTKATQIRLQGNLPTSCGALSSLIAALGSPPVNISSAISGTNCTLP